MRAHIVLGRRLGDKVTKPDAISGDWQKQGCYLANRTFARDAHYLNGVSGSKAIPTVNSHTFYCLNYFSKSI